MAALTKKRVQFYLRPDQLEALRALARRRNVALAELIRQGVDRLLAEIPLEGDPLWSLVGLYDSGLGDVAEKHDEYLARLVCDENRR